MSSVKGLVQINDILNVLIAVVQTFSVEFLVDQIEHTIFGIFSTLRIFEHVLAHVVKNDGV